MSVRSRHKDFGPKTAKKLRRRPAKKDPMRRVLIVAEGEITEVEYFEALKSHLKLSNVDLEICGKECDSSPTSVVQFALNRADSEGSYKRGGYNDVFCVFDRDDHQDFDRALSQISGAKKSQSKFKGERIDAIPSYPCFEYWLLLHLQFSRTPFAAANGKTVAQVVTAELKKHSEFKSFDKALTGEMREFLLHSVQKAIKNAEKAEKDANQTSSQNPSTQVHVLVKFLMELSGQNKAR